VVTYTEPTVFDMLAALDADPSQQTVPTRRDYRTDVRRAVAQAAAEHRGYVHASWVRPHLPADIPPRLIGAVISGLHLSGHLCVTTRPALPNGGPSGNATKLSRVSRLVRPIEGVAA
jgi:hypothetical protein